MEGSSPRRRVALRAVALLSVLAVSLAASSKPALSEPGFDGLCKTRVIRDYAGFLRNLPPLAPGPIDERLPFAPERVYFRSLGNGPLQAGDGVRGFRLSYSPYGPEAGNPPIDLDWHVTATLTSIDQFGQPLAPAQTVEQRIDQLWPTAPGGAGEVRWPFYLPGDPAIYRLEIVFENESGGLLGAFGEYFRVLTPSVDFRFSLNKKRFLPGQTVRAKLSNYGVSVLAFGYGKAIEYHDGTSWTKPPVAFGDGPALAIRLHAGPGTSRSCWKATIPRNAAPGRYRFATGVEVLQRLMPTPKQRRIVRAGFTILPRRGSAR